MDGSSGSNPRGNQWVTARLALGQPLPAQRARLRRIEAPHGLAVLCRIAPKDGVVGVDLCASRHAATQVMSAAYDCARAVVLGPVRARAHC